MSSSEVANLSTSELNKLEEAEREERIKNGADPLLLGKHYTVQEELIQKGYTSGNNAVYSSTPLPLPSLETQAKESLREAASTAKDAAISATIASKDAVLAAKDGASSAASSLGAAAGNLIQGASHLISEAKEMVSEKLSGYTDPSSMAAEERERVRREGLKIDPVVEGRKHRVEEELLGSVKSQ